MTGKASAYEGDLRFVEYMGNGADVLLSVT